MSDSLTQYQSSAGYTHTLLEMTARLKKFLPEADGFLENWENVIRQTSNGQVEVNNYFRAFSDTHNLNEQQKLLLAAVLTSYSHPTLYYSLIINYVKNKNNVLGMVNDKNMGIMYPTVQTLLFLLYGHAYENYTSYAEHLLNDTLFKNGLFETCTYPDLLVKNNPLCQVVYIGDDYLPFFFTGRYGEPRFSASFPARKITTNLNWSDLVLDAATLAQVREITSWHKHRNVVLNQWNLHKMINPGYKVLFYGPPGTGKTLTAAIMGQELDVDVFRIDLSMVVSKYIGETEKNLSNLFDRAMNKNWILFFDEADALFGSRTEVRDSHDRYANQEVSYLLQRLENYNGIVILASNLKGNIDRAFSRRFQNMIRFKVPDAEQRKLLWSNSFSGATVLEDNLSINDLARMYEVTGGNIVNVVQYASLKAAERGSNVIHYNDVKNGIIRELAKEGKTP